MTTQNLKKSQVSHQPSVIHLSYIDSELTFLRTNRPFPPWQ